MAGKLNIIICDDQDVEHRIIDDSFIKNTFLKSKVNIKNIYYFKSSPNNEVNLIDYLSDSKNDVDYIFLDLNFDPEGIFEHEIIISTIIESLSANKRESKVLLLSKDGADTKRGKNTEVNGIELPLIRKSAKFDNIHFFLVENHTLWIKSKLIALSFQELKDLRDDILNGKSNVKIKDREYFLDCFFAFHNNQAEMLACTYDIPSFEFDGWDTHNSKYKFSDAIKKYEELKYNNGFSIENYYKWFEKAKNYLIATYIRVQMIKVRYKLL